MSNHFFITGVSFGSCRGIVQRLTQNGAKVFGVARTRTALEQLQQEVGKERFSYTVFDIADLASDPNLVLAQMQ